jgi:hypothetical protein
VLLLTSLLNSHHSSRFRALLNTGTCHGYYTMLRPQMRSEPLYRLKDEAKRNEYFITHSPLLHSPFLQTSTKFNTLNERRAGLVLFYSNFKSGSHVGFVVFSLISVLLSSARSYRNPNICSKLDQAIDLQTTASTPSQIHARS